MTKEKTAMWFKNPPPPPPVPAGVREMLKDYPEVIEDLQESLNKFVNKRLGAGFAHPAHVFEEAIWLLKDSLGSWQFDAEEEWRAAKASGDQQAIERADKKSYQIAHARRKVARGGLKEYFEQHMEAFK